MGRGNDESLDRLLFYSLYPLLFHVYFYFLPLLLCPAFTDNAELQQSLTQSECLLRLHVHIAL